MRVTMKIYPVKERVNGIQWSESQKERMITLQLINGAKKLTSEALNEFYQESLRMGYAALDHKTHMKIVKIENLHKEQVEINKLFEITLVS